ncbi:amino acid permease GAP1 [Aspergillus clavatus NRRL 1]|uniref:Amino acid permease (Gap1), putative n=1 Tax=Aspergillus clavatus (strain ATCC 1007 / CBS 513.65 / DSM 816 / NCTC 3887 / NRRL 1 / QM 1276 / 107) TaxID=344612 RepID=A1CDB6_ASPCL|nr:amino acid permease (Gap1), putative [Aspergillus clavatus NRRL 1]EAW11843.1 amino acid permease (Gap1), putative [Aspergillus clavatus NRRL 1]
MEKDIIEPKAEATSSSDSPPIYGETETTKGSLGRRIWDSFKRDPNAHVVPTTGSDGKTFDIEQAAKNTAASPLQRRLKNRHLQMIAIGGSIGTGLFVGSGKVLAAGGPASVLIAYALIGCMLYCTVHALGEMAVLFPVAGSFAHYSTRFVDPAWGFAMGWNYALQWLIVLPLEIVAASITVDYWDSNISNAVWVAIFWVVIVAINLFGVRGYGEAEFVFSIIKVVAVIGFIILGIVLNCGGGPKGGYIGGKYWHDPGAFNNGFKGLCSVFVNAAFAFAGTELVGLAAAETANPRKSLPTAVKQVFWRICLFYIVALALVGLLVPYDEPRLLNGSSSSDAKASPFVISIKNAGISGLDSVMNVVIMIAVLSVGNASVYGSSRTLAAMADQRQAPQFLSYIDRQGRPLWAILIASAFGLLGFLAASDKQGDAFTWMMAISGLSSVLTWGSVCLAHIRFRKAWKVQGHSLNELAFVSQAGLIGSWIGFLFNCLVLVAQFWIGFAPIGYGEMSSGDLVESWFSVYLAAPVVLLFYIPYKIYYRTPFLRAKDMDLHTGRRELDIQHLIEEERAEQAAWPLWKKVYKVFC